MKSFKITSLNIIAFISALSFTSSFIFYWVPIAILIVNIIFAAVVWGYLIFCKNLPEYITKKIRISDIIIALMGVSGFFATRYELLTIFFERIKITKAPLIEANSVFIFIMNNISIFICCGLIVVAIIVFLLFAGLSIKIKPLIIDFLKKIDRTERIFLYVFSVILFVFSAFLFSRTTIFYNASNEETQSMNDVIYVSDSSSIVEGNAYINSEHGENDIRQPLFGVFAMPFACIVKAVSLPFQISWFYPWLLNCLQIFLLMISIILIVKLLKIECVIRKLLILILFVSSYSVIIFSFMMEQYIFAVWWLTLFLYYTIDYKRINILLLVATAGSLITSAVLALPFIGYLKSIRNAMVEIGKFMLILIGLISVFGLMNTFIDALDQILNLTTAFGGANITIMDKLYQFTAFITNIFTSPEFNTSINFYGSPQIVLPSYSTVNYFGVGIFLLAIAGFCLDYKNMFKKTCFIWLLFSVLLLVMAGYGANENGMILYSLYFLWAFMSLMVSLINRLFGKLPVIEYGVYIIATGYMLFCNIQTMIDIFNYGVKHYPL